ncbi:MAG: hypothetical protein M1357_02915, partial [Candidatus Marsarchaeota archaeon]|nr:hypothetical protein [Candidatus Marsarchaeota archaeon]
MTLAPFPSTVQGAVIAAVIASVAKASAAVLIKWVTTVLYYYTNWLRIIYPNPGYSTLLESATTLFDVVILVGVIELIRNMVRRRHVELLTAITKGDASSRRHLESNPSNKGA